MAQQRLRRRPGRRATKQAGSTTAPEGPLVLGILIFDGVEVLDCCGPFEVFSTVRIDPNANRRVTEGPIRVLLVGCDDGDEGADDASGASAEEDKVDERKLSLITATGGMKLQPHVSTRSCPPLDVIVGTASAAVQ